MGNESVAESPFLYYYNRLKQVKQINMEVMYLVYDVCDMPNRDLVVATKNGLYHTQPNGKHRQH